MQQKTEKTIPHNNNLQKTYTPPEIKKLDQITKMTLGSSNGPDSDSNAKCPRSGICPS